MYRLVHDGITIDFQPVLRFFPHFPQNRKRAEMLLKMAQNRASAHCPFASHPHP